MAKKKRFFGRSTKGLLGAFAPGLSGLLDQLIDPRSPIDGVGSLLIGYGLGNDFSKNIGLYKAGASAAAFIPTSLFGGTTTPVSGGYM